MWEDFQAHLETLGNNSKLTWKHSVSHVIEDEGRAALLDSSSALGKERPRTAATTADDDHDDDDDDDDDDDVDDDDDDEAMHYTSYLNYL